MTTEPFELGVYSTDWAVTAGREPVVPSSEEMAMGKGSFDNGDPETTNLYVGNLAATITEEALEVWLGLFV